MTIPWPSSWNPQSWTTFNPKKNKCYDCGTPTPVGVIYQQRSTPFGPVQICRRCETGDRGPYYDSAAWHAEQDQIEGAA